MRSRDMKRMLSLAPRLTPGQRLELLGALHMQAAGAESVAVVQARLQTQLACPHCRGERVVCNGQASGLQRYKCRGCAKTFNALTGTPLARLRHKAKWLEQAQVLHEGLSVHAAAERLQVAASTAFRWRHRFLTLPQEAKAASLHGVAEADETFFLRSFKGQRLTKRASRSRGGKAAKRGLSQEQVPVLVARDRSGSTTDFILEAADKVHVVAALRPVLPADAILCTDGSGMLAAVAKQLGIEHHALNASAGVRVQGPWHIQNVNAYHGRLKEWLRRFHGVATSHLASYLGWFRALDRSSRNPTTPAQLLALAVSA